MAELDIIIRAKDEASAQLQGISGQINNMSKTMAIAGGIMVAAGTAITGALAMTVKAAAKEEAGIVRLSTALGNMGISYDEVRGSLEKWIDTQQQKTAVADDAQRESLSSLIVATGDLTKAQELLTTAMDLARWKNIDLKTASDILVRVYAGNVETLSRYGIVVKEGATETEALAEIQRLAAGQAEAYGRTMAGQFELLQNNIGDLKEAIGTALIPAFSGLIEKANEWVQIVKEWISIHPELTKIIVWLTGATGIALLTSGLGLLALVMVAKVIPATIAMITALWALVAAKLAAMAATGVLAPAVIGLAAGIGLLTYGIWELAKSQTAQINTTLQAAQATNKQTDASIKAASAQDLYSTKVAKTTNEIEAQTKATETQTKAIETLRQETMRSFAGMGAHLAPGSRLAELWAGTGRKRDIALAQQLELEGFTLQAQQLRDIIGEYQHGGIVRETGLAYVHKGETVIPANANITIPIYLDGDLITTRVERRMMDRVRLQGIG